MAIIDISTEQEAKASNYSRQCKVADHWNRFAKSSNGHTEGEFNIFFFDGTVSFEQSTNKILIKGHKQITNYWAGPGSMLIEQKLRFSEHTSIETELGIRISSFRIFKSGFLKTLFAKILSKSCQLDPKYTLTTNDEHLIHTINNVWGKAKINRYTGHNLELGYNSENGRLKMKFYKMLDRENELENLSRDFNLILNEIKNST
jgi:hypothetical protein